jgi:signal transduction histidine kinase
LGAVLLGLDSALQSLPQSTERAASRLQTARRAALQARETVAKLLFYSREAGQGMRKTEVNQVVSDTLKLLGHHLSLEQIQVQWNPGQVSLVRANPNELQQVLTNLILNARDALLQSDPPRRLWLATRCEGAQSVIEVEDSGPGIPLEIRDRVFDPFFTTKPVGQGTGLGLWVSLEIMRRHQGTLVQDSAPGRTRFSLRLPVAPEACDGTWETTTH